MVDFQGKKWIVGCLGIIALLLSLIGNFWCKYTSVLFRITNNLTGSSRDFKSYYGLWNYRDTSVSYTVTGGDIYATQRFFCTPYNQENDNIDPNATWKTAQAFAIIAVVIGGLATCFSCCSNYEVEQVSKLNMALPLTFAFLLTTICQGLTFLFFSSNACNTIPPLSFNALLYTLEYNNSCALEAASIISIVGCVLWFFTTIAAGLAIATERKMQSST